MDCRGKQVKLRDKYGIKITGALQSNNMASFLHSRPPASKLLLLAWTAEGLLVDVRVEGLKSLDRHP
jgi:hypothetical protein